MSDPVANQRTIRVHRIVSACICGGADGAGLAKHYHLDVLHCGARHTGFPCPGGSASPQSSLDVILAETIKQIRGLSGP